jgi:hypothetical protein
MGVVSDSAVEADKVDGRNGSATPSTAAAPSDAASRVSVDEKQIETVVPAKPPAAEPLKASSPTSGPPAGSGGRPGGPPGGAGGGPPNGKGPGPGAAYSAFSPARRRLTLAIVMIAGFFGPLAAGVYLPALPILQREFDTSATTINATVSIFMAVLAIGVSDSVTWIIISQSLKPNVDAHLATLLGCLCRLWRSSPTVPDFSSHLSGGKYPSGRTAGQPCCSLHLAVGSRVWSSKCALAGKRDSGRYHPAQRSGFGHVVGTPWSAVRPCIRTIAGRRH